MSGIIGDNSSSQSEPSAEPLKIAESASSKSQPEPSSQRRPGRPKNGNDNTRTTFIISAELLRKIKYISLMDDRLQTDVVGEALSLYVSKWELDNGKIKLTKK